MKAAFYAFALLSFAPALLAAGSAKHPAPRNEADAPTFLYVRDRVFIEVEAPLAPIVPTEGPTPQTANQEQKPDAPTSETRRYFFDTEIRPEETLALDWFYSLETIGEGHATMIVFKTPHELDLPEAKILKPVDVLVIGKEGTILAILPGIVLAQQDKKVNLDMKVKALMYIPGGDAEKLHIAPKDVVKNKLFLANPVVLQ